MSASVPDSELEGRNERPLKRVRGGAMEADSFTRNILMKDLIAMQKNPLPFAWLPDDVLIDDNILTWQLWLVGPESTAYEGGVFKVRLTFPPTYPNEPPEMRFDTPIWHPNVYTDGRVCISILHKPGGTAEVPDDTPASECWRPILNIEAIVVSVLSMLSDPNFDSPANLDASIQMRKDAAAFQAKVKGLVEESRKNLPPGFKLPGDSNSNASTGAEFDWEPDDDGTASEDEEEEGSGATDDDGLTKSEQGVIREVCEMGFDREAVLKVVQALKGRGKEISNDSVAERMLEY